MTKSEARDILIWRVCCSQDAKVGCEYCPIFQKYHGKPELSEMCNKFSEQDIYEAIFTLTNDKPATLFDVGEVVATPYGRGIVEQVSLTDQGIVYVVVIKDSQEVIAFTSKQVSVAS